MTEPKMPDRFILPDDLSTKVAELAQTLGVSPREIVIAAMDNFTRIPTERQKAILVANARRRT
ncbi:MAG: hypothetical protein LDL33_03870 [Desulfomonile sp.]|nr:hypothetical protein [Desulfomonile sp.]